MFGWFKTLREILDEIRGFRREIMSGLTDLQAAIAQMQADWQTFLANLTAALSNEDSDAAVEAASQLVAQQDQAIQAENAVVTGTTPPGS
jgi:heme oxygenase